jgi:hypothetical protein
VIQYSKFRIGINWNSDGVDVKCGKEKSEMYQTVLLFLMSFFVLDFLLRDYFILFL